MPTLVEKALAATSESKQIEFKGEFEGSAAEWCEILKDIFAMANSGGGVFVFGLDNKGKPTQADVGAFLRTDPADITNKIHKYTADDFASFEIFDVQKDGWCWGAY